MPTTLGFKDIVTLPQWRPLSSLPIAPAATASVSNFVQGQHLTGDMRNNIDCHPLLYWYYAQAAVWVYDVKNDGWVISFNPNMSTVGAGCASVFCPSKGPSGTLAAGATTTSVVLNTALPATVGVNQLANRGDGQGFKIRIIGNSGSSASGLTEERYIVGNTAGTTPTIQLDTALSFTPAATDGYEILSGRIFYLSSAAANGWKYYDIATNSMSASLSVVNLPTINTDSSLLALDELYVPYTNDPGEGYFGNLTATASGAATLTGQAVGGDAAVLLNEYRNFQIRIVNDVATPTAAGQRRRIVSHTAGASPVYTVAAWTIQPSADAVFVIENDTDKILLWTGGQQSTYNYNITANTWDTTTWATRGTAMGTGCVSVLPFGITLDAGKNARYSQIHSFRGGVTTLDIFDIAAGANGVWTLASAYKGHAGFLPTSGWFGTYCPATQGGQYVYFGANSNALANQRFYRYDIKNRVVEPWAFLNYGATLFSGGVGARMASTVFVDGTTKISFIHKVDVDMALMWQCLITR